MTTAIAKLAERFSIGSAQEASEILKATAFKTPDGKVTDAQMAALCVVAQQYGLNPFTKEIYAFPDQRNGIVPVVGVDGWARIINDHPQFDGLAFEQTETECTCIIYRKDRAHPTRVTEYMSECARPNVMPWKSHPKRMLRHKSLIQCARLAFGFGGIFDQDEAERIVESKEGSIDGASRRVTEAPELPPLSAQLESDARTKASDGTGVYAAWFQNISKDERRSLGGIHDELKAIAAQVDESFAEHAATQEE